LVASMRATRSAHATFPDEKASIKRRAKIGLRRCFPIAASVLALVAALATGAAQAAGRAYVSNSGSATVSQYGIGTDGGLFALSPPTVAASSYAAGVAMSPDGKSVYVACAGVCQFDVDPLAGTLSSKTPASVAAEANPWSVAVSPNGKSAYLTNSSGNTVSQYDIDPLSGGLSPKSSPSVAAGSNPNTIAVTPDNRSAYVANGADGTVTQYDIDPLSGALSPKTPRSVAAGRAPYGVAVTPDGRSAFVTGGDAIFQYAIDSPSGSLLPKTPASVAVGPNALGIALTADGKDAYVADSITDSVYQYDVDSSSGTLSPKTPGSVFTGRLPWAVAVTADGMNAYVPTLSGVSQYDIDPLNGNLSPKSPATVAGGSGPGIAVSPPPNRSPDCRSVAPSRTVLTNVNRRLVAITLEGATDPDGDAVTLSVDGVTQDEPVVGSGDHTSPDAVDEGEGELRVRAERNPRGDGRVYRIAFTASDGHSGSCSGTATVSVPRKRHKPAVDSAPPSYDSFAR
jgi:DNA-binding beta-propeller fold protein YncE